MTFEFLEVALSLVLGATACTKDQLRAFCTGAVTAMSPEEFNFLNTLSDAALGDWVLETVPAHWRL